MHTALIIVSILTALILLVSGMMKLTKHPKVVEQIGAVGVPLKFFPVLAGLEIAAAAGILIGLGVKALGVAAAPGAVLYMIGAIASHIRVKDTKGMFNPLVPLIMSAVTLALRVKTKA